MLDVAIEAAKAAGQLAYRYFKTQLKVTYKPLHHSPVTKADKEAETLIRKIISKKFPDHGFIGEEFGSTNRSAKYHWVIDPIDGTRDFIRGLPFWSTLIAVLEKDRPIIGICFFPTYDEIFIAEKGKGTYLNGRKTRVSKVSDLKSAYVTPSSAHHFATHHKVKQLVKLCETVAGARYFSTYGNNLLWKGKIDAYVNARGGPWDFAAPAIITEEAGGKFSDFDCNYSFDSDCGLFSNGKIHSQILKILNS